MLLVDREDHNIGSRPVFVVVMGVSGTGKSTLGSALAQELGMPYVEGDDLHPASNIAKMSAGTPLSDADREPWLARIRATAERMTLDQVDRPESRQGVVISSSALKKYYRDILRGKHKVENTYTEDTTPPRELPTYFVFIDGARDILLERMEKRSGHYMKAKMLDSQLEILEDPSREDDVVVVPVEDSTQEQLRRAVKGLTELCMY